MSKSLGNVIDPLDIINGISLEAILERARNSNLADAEINNAEKAFRKRFPNGIKAYGPDGLR